jgi:hypothetical protein
MAMPRQLDQPGHRVAADPSPPVNDGKILVPLRDRSFNSCGAPSGDTPEGECHRAGSTGRAA